VLFLTVLGTLLVMWLAGIELERISLGALIIAMGMLVDNAVVVCDGMLVRQRQGKSILEASQQTLQQTQWPLLGATIIGILAFAGIGNIGASLIGSEGSRGLASHPGIVGVRFRKAHVFDYPQGEAQLLLLFSDGLQSRWSLRDYPGLIQRHPAIIATLLHRDFCRGRDDVTVLALNLEAPRG